MAKRRINPEVNLPATIQGGGTLVDTFERGPREPRPDTSLLQGFATFSQGLSAYVKTKNELEVKNLKDEWASEFKEMGVEELEHAILSEEGKTIYEGMAPGRQRLYQEFAGKRYAELKAEAMYDPAFRAKLMDPTNPNVDIGAAVDQQARDALAFQEGHNAAFRRSAQGEMDNARGQIKAQFRQERGMRIKAQNQRQLESEMSTLLESYGTSTAVDNREVAEAAWRELANKHNGPEGATGENPVTGMMAALDGNVTSELKNMTPSTDLDNLREQVGFAKHMLKKSGDFDRWQVEINDLENRLDKAEFGQDPLLDQQEARQRAKVGRELSDSASQYFQENATNLEGVRPDEMFNGYTEYLKKIGREDLIEEAKKDYYGFTQSANIMARERPPSATERAAEDKQVREFMSGLYRGDFGTAEEARKAWASIGDGIEMSGDGFRSGLLEVDKWDSQTDGERTAVAKLVASRSAIQIGDKVRELADEVAEARHGVTANEHLDAIRDDFGKRGEWNARWSELESRLAAEVTAGIQDLVTEKVTGDMTRTEALALVTDEDVQGVLDQAMIDYREVFAVEAELEQASASRATNEAAQVLTGNELTEDAKPAAAFSLLSGGQLPLGGDFGKYAKEAGRILSSSDTAPAERLLLWEAAKEGSAVFNNSIGTRFGKLQIQRPERQPGDSLMLGNFLFDRTRGGTTLMTFNGRPSPAHTQLYLGVRQMGIDPYTPAELRGEMGPRRSEKGVNNPDDPGGWLVAGWRQDKNGVGLSNTEMRTESLYHPGRTLYATDDESLKFLADSGLWKEYVDLYEERFDAVPLPPNTPTSEVADEKLKWFLRAQQTLINFYGLSAKTEAVTTEETETE